MNSNASLSRILLLCAAFVVVVAGMRAASVVIVPFLLAAFLAVILSPALHALWRLGLPTGIALLIVVTALVFVGGRRCIRHRQIVQGFLQPPR